MSLMGSEDLQNLPKFAYAGSCFAVHQHPSGQSVRTAAYVSSARSEHPKFHQVSIESTHSRSWVSDRAGFGCGLGMPYPHQDGCGGVAGGTSPVPCPTPIAPFARVCTSSRTSRVSGVLQSSQDNDIAHVLKRDLHIVEITRNL